MAEKGERPFHARQVAKWVFEKRAEGFAGMSDLPKDLRERLDEEWTVFAGSGGSGRPHHNVAPRWNGQAFARLSCEHLVRKIECVLMAEDDRRTVCVSTQVGCGMGCVFCASGLKGVERNLTTGEIVEQVLRLRNLLPAGERLTNLVVMGMGESLANLDNLGRSSSIGSVRRRDWPVESATGDGLRTVGLPEKMR